MANIENKEKTNTPINKTTETLLKELETMSDTGRDRQKFCVKVNKYFQSDETQEGEGN